MEKDKIYLFAYTDCFHEDSPSPISAHYTPKGAEMAMGFHKEERRKEWLDDMKEGYKTRTNKNKTFEEHCEEYHFDKMERWVIIPMDIKD